VPGHDPSALAPGDILPGGRYSVEAPLAQGGRATVWEGTDLERESPVVVKTPRADLAADDDVLADLRAEALVGGLAEHPSLVRTLDLIEAGGSAYLVQALAPGRPLAERLRHDGPLDYRLALRVLAQIARGVRALHNADHVHRDVSAANIMWDGARATLIDLGIALRIGTPPLTLASRVPGNPDYLAPELSLGRDATPAADLYSLGVVLLYAITGRKPFSGATPEDIAAAHVMSPSPPIPAHLPSGLRYLMRRLLDKDPARRPGNALAVARVFEAFAAA
jgi:serine/threonine-protein kinase